MHSMTPEGTLVRSRNASRRDHANAAMDPSQRGQYARWGKRAFDVPAVLVLILLTLPLTLFLALLTRIWLGSPVLFLQTRPGLNGRPFRLIKFRTMTNKTDGTQLLPDGERLTRFGRFMRNTSLDELPQFFNVLRGEMSLVGPRPLLMQYLSRYDQVQRRRHDVLPGMTGWAQVRGRNLLSWKEKFQLDVYYVDHISFRLDLYILLLTLWRTITRTGISPPGSDTAEEFKGTI